MAAVLSKRTRGRLSILVIGVFVVFAALLAGNVLVVAGKALLGTVGVDVSQPIVKVTLSSVLLQGAGFGAIALGFYGVYQRTVEDGTEYVSLREFVLLYRPSRPQLLFAVAGYLLLFAVALLTALVSSLLGVAPAPNEIATIAQQQPVTLLLLAALSYLVVAPAEELLYRGIIQLHFREAFSPSLAIAATSFIFAISHIGAISGTGVTASLISVFLISVILGAFYEYTDNLAVPILMHGSYNATQFLLLYIRA